MTINSVFFHNILWCKLSLDFNSYMLYLFIKLIIFSKHKTKISLISSSQFCRSGNKCLFTTLKYKVSSLSYFIHKNMGRRDDSVQNLITERGYKNKKLTKQKSKPQCQWQSCASMCKTEKGSWCQSNSQSLLASQSVSTGFSYLTFPI